ncbi:MAG: PcfJ domain-containing protein [Acetatifactor sp.]|nr:PcfJ domain-containing protein [Acetatifactor sp.]
MRKPNVKFREIPAEAAEAISRIEKVPKLYHGMEYEYSRVICPETDGGLLVLRWYNVELAREGEEQDFTEEYITYIDVPREEWMTYVCREEKWSRASIENMGGRFFPWRRVLLLHPEKLEAYMPFCQDMEKQEVYEPIRRNSGEAYMEAVVWWQNSVNNRKLKRKQERKDERTNRLMSQAKPLSEAFLRWHEETAMKDSRYLIYIRSGGKRFRAFCTHCKAYIDMPAERCAHNRKGKCPQCGSRITMKSSGRAKHIEDEAWTEYVQAVEGGLMIRFVKMTKIYECHKKPVRIVEEPCRVMILKGEPPVWYEKRESHTVFESEAEYQRNRTDGCAHGYNFPRKDKFRMVYRRGLARELEKAFPYHMFWEWFRRSGKDIKQYTVYDYFEAYSCFPFLESLEKTGKTKLVNEIVEKLYSCKKTYERKATTVSGMLGISRQQYRRLYNPSPQDISVCRFLNKRGIVLDEIELYRLRRYVGEYTSERDLETVMAHTSLQKFMRYAEKQDKYKIRHYYYDYLKMSEELGYDFRDKSVLFPRNLQEAHDTAVELLAERKNKKRQAEEKEINNSISRVEEKIRRQFSFEDDVFLIRPAKTGAEIVKEGQIQHICVGSNREYRKRMAEGERYILFLRRKDEPNNPFYTVEITPDYKIVQRHGKYNKENQEVDSVDRFLKKFVEVKGHGKEYHAEQ